MADLQYWQVCCCVLCNHYPHSMSKLPWWCLITSWKLTISMLISTNTVFMTTTFCLSKNRSVLWRNRPVKKNHVGHTREEVRTRAFSMKLWQIKEMVLMWTSGNTSQEIVTVLAFPTTLTWGDIWSLLEWSLSVQGHRFVQETRYCMLIISWNWTKSVLVYYIII